MDTMNVNYATDHRLRVIFDDTVMLYRIAANTTYGDIAEMVKDLELRQDRTPIGIDVTLQRSWRYFNA